MTDTPIDLLSHNRAAWNREVANGNPWTIPVGPEDVAAARRGDIKIYLTPHIPVPTAWLGELAGRDVLGLASGGGQQGPLLAAAGANVTIFDNSDAQLQRDADAADRFDLHIATAQGNMQDLSCFADAAFDLIVHPVSNVFIDDVLPVWREAYRVLRPGGSLLSGFVNPVMYMLDWDAVEAGKSLELRHAIPYADPESLPPEVKQTYLDGPIPFEFGHSLGDLIGGQIAAGFAITGFYEDKGEPTLDPLIDPFIATRAFKP